MVSESGYRKRMRGTRPAGPDAVPDIADSIAIPTAAEQLASIATGIAVKEENRYPDRSQPSGPALGSTVRLRREDEPIGLT